MSTIKSTKKVNLYDIKSLLSLMKEYGPENVKCHNTYDFVHYSIEHNVHIDVEVWEEVFAIAHKETLNDLLGRIIGNSKFNSFFAQSYNMTPAQFASKLIDLAIKNGIFLHRVSEHTPIDKLKELAERNLVSLYFVENVNSIDVDFVSKYHQELDLGSLYNRTTNTDVRDFIYNLKIGTL